MKGKITLIPIKENGEEDDLSRVVIDIEVEKESERIGIFDKDIMYIPNAKEYSVNVKESGSYFNDEFEVFSSCAGCTIKTKKPDTRFSVARKWIN